MIFFDNLKMKEKLRFLGKYKLQKDYYQIIGLWEIMGVSYLNLYGKEQGKEK